MQQPNSDMIHMDSLDITKLDPTKILFIPNAINTVEMNNFSFEETLANYKKDYPNSIPRGVFYPNENMDNYFGVDNPIKKRIQHLSLYQIYEQLNKSLNTTSGNAKNALREFKLIIHPYIGVADLQNEIDFIDYILNRINFHKHFNKTSDKLEKLDKDIIHKKKLQSNATFCEAWQNEKVKIQGLLIAIDKEIQNGKCIVQNYVNPAITKSVQNMTGSINKVLENMYDLQHVHLQQQLPKCNNQQTQIFMSVSNRKFTRSFWHCAYGTNLIIQAQGETDLYVMDWHDTDFAIQEQMWGRSSNEFKFITPYYKEDIDSPKKHQQVFHLKPGDAFFMPPFFWHRIVAHAGTNVLIANRLDCRAMDQQVMSLNEYMTHPAIASNLRRRPFLIYDDVSQYSSLQSKTAEEDAKLYYGNKD